VIYLTMTGQPTADRIMTQETDRFVQ